MILPYNPYTTLDAKSNLLSFCLDMAQGHMNGAPSETQTHPYRFTCVAC